MDYEERQRRQFIRVLIAEIGMVIAVIAIVVIATLAAMGFFISSDGQIEQSGLLQLHSLPTGATVELDGATLFARTNLSRTMPSGDHTLRLSRDGYDSWEKTITMRPGALLRLYYPRLFLQNRTPEPLRALTSSALPELEFYNVSENRNYILYALKDSPVWHLLNVRGDEVRDTALDLSDILPGIAISEPKKSAPKTEPTKTFTGDLLSLKWSSNEEKILAHLRAGDDLIWLLIDLRDPSKSQNLNTTFGTAFDRVEIIDSSASQLYALEHNQLRRLNLAGGTMSRVLLKDVTDFVNRGSSLIYLAPAPSSSPSSSSPSPAPASDTDIPSLRQIGVYREGDEAGTVITTVPDHSSIRIALSRYFDEDYICYTIDQTLTVLYGQLPTYKPAGNTSLDELKTLLADEPLSLTPEHLTVSLDGEYLVARTGTSFVVTDLDTGKLHSYTSISPLLRWLDASMLYTVQDGNIIVWDFDGTNLRTISSDVLDYPVMITSNNLYLYYLTRNSDNLITLTRERIRD